jgi:uncharacterized protein
MMIPYRAAAFGFVLGWLALVGARFRHSKPVLVGGLLVVGASAIVAMMIGAVEASELGLGRPRSWLATIGGAAAWTVVMLAYSPLADALARRRFPERPNLAAFAPLQQSRIKLVIGIAIAWVLGGFLEELTFRGVVLQSIDRWLSPVLPGPVAATPVAATIAILAAAFGAGVVHLYQGPRAAVVIIQLSALFGLLMVISGNNLWTVVICHGLYDTVAFIRFANRTSRYASRPR